MGKSELTNIVNKCCDILRTDDGISGAVHYTEVLSWLLYLKFFDDKEKERKEMMEIEGEKYTPFLEKKYRWENWASDKSGLTGKELISFINDDLFPYLASLKGQKEGDPRDIIAAIFANSVNRVNSGYLLRDVISEIQKINFDVGDEVFTLSHVYEDLLKSMQEGGGNNGEFYTPRSLVRAMVKLLNPKIGETVYDPACGTGGFLAEAHLQMKDQAKTPDKRRFLNYKTFYGQEKTPLPFVLCLMNLTLHGMDFPRIAKGNTLSRDIRTIEDHEKYDVIIANPPFGGKEQKMIQANFPIEANATEILFMQHIEKMLKVNGRAAVIIPEGVLFQTNAAYMSFKKKLLEECNLHTVVSLPSGVFLPYSAVKTSVILFDKTKRTKDVWFYELPLVDSKKLTKKNGIGDKHFEDLLKAFKERKETERSWLVPVERILEAQTNLSASHYNPHGVESEELLEPEQYAEEIKGLLQDSLKNIESLLSELS
jgi:type I restriction enzyme M protein